jgi:hypothetical protein
MKIDYPELEGKEVDFIMSSGKIEKIKVIGVSYHVGITAILIDDPTFKVVCLNAKIHRGKELSRIAYRKQFHAYVKAFQEGTLDYRKFMKKAYPAGRIGVVGNQNCAFE